MPAIDVPLRAPELAPGDWIQGPEIEVLRSRGGVVLIDFWESTCVNCLRTLPYLSAWHERYVARGLAIVGVHTPEFPFTAEAEHVRRAVAAEGLRYSILSDPERATWSRFANRVWPAKYLVDARGYLRYETFGEGRYDETERFIQRLLGEAGDPGPWPQPFEPFEPDSSERGAVRDGGACRPATAEVHVGWHRGRLFATEGYRPGEVVAHGGGARGEVPLGGLLARGAFRHEADYLESAAPGAELALRYEAAAVNLVVEPAGEAEILLDGQPVPRALRGADLTERGGTTHATWERGRMVRLIAGEAADSYGDHRLTVRFERAGLRAYAFSFGGCG